MNQCFDSYHIRKIVAMVTTDAISKVSSIGRTLKRGVFMAGVFGDAVIMLSLCVIGLLAAAYTLWEKMHGR